MTDTLTSAGWGIARTPIGLTCHVHRHRDYVPLNTHHVIPLGLGGPDVAANKVVICMNAHGLVHEAIRRLMDNNGHIPEYHRFGAKVIELARQGWEGAGKPTNGNGGE